MREDKEIDIYSVIRFISKFVGSHKISISSIFAVCILLAVSHHYLVGKDKHYCSISFLSNSLSFELIEKIQTPLGASIIANSNDSLSKWLNLPKESVANLTNLVVKKVLIPTNDENVSAAFQLIFTGNDYSAIEHLDTAVLNYLNYNRYIQEATALRKENLTAYQQNIQQQISRLDSIQELIPSAIAGDNKNTPINDFNLGLIYQQMTSLKNLETKVTTSLEMADEFSMVSSFKWVEKKSLFVKIVTGILIGSVLTIFLGLFYTLRVMMKKAHQQ